MSDSSPANAAAKLVDTVVTELEANNFSAIPTLFAGMSEPKRSAFRKEYLVNHSLYGTVQTIEASMSEIRQDPMAMFRTSRKQFEGAILLDLAVGNRDEVLYALRPAVSHFPDLVLPILQQRETTKLFPAIAKNLISDVSDAFPAWALFVENGIIPMSWDDRTVSMICHSGFSADSKSIPKLAEQDPVWNEIVYRMCEVENWFVTSIIDGGRTALDFIDQLSKTKQLDRVRLLRSSLSGMHLVKNQNQTKACEMVFDFLAPTLDEVADCQADLCAVLDQGKPVSFSFVFEKLDKLVTAKRIDGPMVCVSVGAAFSRAGIAQSTAAIKLLQGALDSPDTLDCGCSALAQALLHNKREIAERAWKVLLPALPQANQSVLHEIEQARQMVQGTLGKTISDYFASCGRTDSNSPTDYQAGSIASSETEFSWEELVSQLQSVPIAVRQSLHCKEACLVSHRAQLPLSLDWGIQNAAVLSSCQKLKPIQTMDELVLRIGRFGHAKENDLEEPELILDGICRFPRAMDPQFQSKTAAIKKNALSNSVTGLSNQWGYPDYALVILNWLGESIPSNPDRFVKNQFDELAHFVVAAAIPWVAEGRAFSLTSTPTHRGGWIDPQIWLDRLEAAQVAGDSLLLADIELALLRLAPDGRTTPIRNVQLLERARRLEGSHALMVRFVMGEFIPWEEMTGSKRLWIAAIRGREPSMEIPSSAAFAKGLGDQLVLQPAKWKREFKNQIGDFSRPKACVVSLDGGELRRWKPTTTETIQPGKPIDASSDLVGNIFLTRFLASQVLVRNEYNLYRNQHPQQLDWYWNSLLNNLVLRSAKKDEIFSMETTSPWLESERPLTQESAMALWLASLTKGDKSKVWLQEVWSQLVETDRLNSQLLLRTAGELAKYEWCMLKRWAEILAPVSTRSNLHAWEIGRLALGLLCTIDIDPRDAFGLVEIVLQAHSTLGIAVTSNEKMALDKYATGKSKKSILELVAIVDKEGPEKVRTAKRKFMIRLQRAQRWANVAPAGFSQPVSLTSDEVDSEHIELASLSYSKTESSASVAATSIEASAAPASDLVPTAKSAAAQTRKALAGKRSEKKAVEIPLGRSHDAMRLFRSSIPGFATCAMFGYYAGAVRAYDESVSKGYASPEDHYLMFLLHHMGFNVSRSPIEFAELLQKSAEKNMSETGREWTMAWLASLATSFATDNGTWMKSLVDSLDLEMEVGYGEPTACVMAIAGMATSSLRSSPLNVPNSLKLQIEKEKKLSHFVDTCVCIENKDTAAFVKCFEDSAKKLANELGRTIKGDERSPRWWPSALLTVLWHSAKHAGIDCSKIGTQYMALVPTAATLELASENCSLIHFPLPENRDQLSLALLDRVMSTAGVRYALLRPRVDTNLLEPNTTDWTIVVDSRDEQAWNRLFEAHNPEECLLNADLQFESLADYQVVLAAIPQYGAIFRRLNVPVSLLDQILEKAERRDFYGASVSVATLEDSVGLLMPILDALSNDSRMSKGKMQNVAYYRRQLEEYKKWVLGLLQDAKREIIWPKIQLVAKQLNADSAVSSIKSSYKPGPV